MLQGIGCQPHLALVVALPTKAISFRQQCGEDLLFEGAFLGFLAEIATSGEGDAMMLCC